MQAQGISHPIRVFGADIPKPYIVEPPGAAHRVAKQVGDGGFPGPGPFYNAGLVYIRWL